MYGPPCHGCGSDMDWLPGRDGENCECGWPDNKSFPIKDETAIRNVSFSSLSEKFIEFVNKTSKTEEEIYYRLFAEEERLNADRYYKIIQAIAAELELEQWTTDNIVQKVRELTLEITEKINRQ